MILPQDYVNYTKISRVDSAGIKHVLYPMSKTSNPFPIKTDSNNDYVFDESENLMSTTNLIANGVFNDDTGWTITSTTGTSWVVGDYVDLNAGGAGIDYTYKNVLYGNNGAVGYIEIEAPEIIEGRIYKITYDVVFASSGGQLILANHTTNASTLNSGSNDNNVDLINGTVVGTYSVEWLQGSSNTGKIKLWNSSGFDGAIDNIRVVRVGGSENSATWSGYKSSKPLVDNHDDLHSHSHSHYDHRVNSRYGLDPQHSQGNGSFYIDEVGGKIHFSSNISEKTVILDYISDSLGNDAEMQVHKFAEEAMYKCIAHAVLAGKSNIPEYQVNRLKKERFAAVRTAKLRLSNLKLEELTQILRGKSKWIKH
jgi:hypothetical protein